MKSLGVVKGDRVCIYLPMVPELAFTMLACARIGAVHSVVFAGFSAQSLRDRIVDAVSADVSRGGMRLVADHRPKLGEIVSLVFFVNGDIVCARGTVRWIAETKRGLFAFGVRFTVLEEDAPSVVASYCAGSMS